MKTATLAPPGGREGRETMVPRARRILTAVYHMLIRREPFRDLGAAYLERRHKSKAVKVATQRLERLGYRVTLEAVAVAAP